jgi:membrane protein YdbS with pleckstrin-like domain
MEEREKEKNSFFATLSKPKNKELKGFLKVYIIIALVNIVTVIIANVLFFLIDEIKLYFWILFGLLIGLILFNLISYVFLLPRAYRFGVKFLIPKILKDLSKELNLEDLKKKN